MSNAIKIYALIFVTESLRQVWYRLSKIRSAIKNRIKGDIGLYVSYYTFGVACVAVDRFRRVKLDDPLWNKYLTKESACPQCGITGRSKCYGSCRHVHCVSCMTFTGGGGRCPVCFPAKEVA